MAVSLELDSVNGGVLLYFNLSEETIETLNEFGYGPGQDLQSMSGSVCGSHWVSGAGTFDLVRRHGIRPKDPKAAHRNPRGRQL